MIQLYKGKKFYVMNPDGTIDGPREDIFYVSVHGKKTAEYKNYRFVQVINGIPVQAFTKKEILVLKNGKQVA